MFVPIMKVTHSASLFPVCLHTVGKAAEITLCWYLQKNLSLPFIISKCKMKINDKKMEKCHKFPYQLCGIKAPWINLLYWHFDQTNCPRRPWCVHASVFHGNVLCPPDLMRTLCMIVYLCQCYFILCSVFCQLPTNLRARFQKSVQVFLWDHNPLLNHFFCERCYINRLLFSWEWLHILIYNKHHATIQLSQTATLWNVLNLLF